MDKLTPAQIRRLRYNLKADRPEKLKRRYSKRMEYAEQRYQEELVARLQKYVL